MCQKNSSRYQIFLTHIIQEISEKIKAILSKNIANAYNYKKIFSKKFFRPGISETHHCFKALLLHRRLHLRIIDDTIFCPG